MKKIALYLSSLAIVALFASCNLNESPVFNNADAFVAFESATYSVNETAGTYKIPVRFTSLGANTATASFILFDGTAVAGRDYQLNGGATVLTFDGKNPVQYINVDILPHTGVFTGDRTFGVAIQSASNAKIGGMDTTYVKILDLDHPLAALLGTYTATGTSYFYGTQTWTVTLAKDPGGDVTKVWITNFVTGGSSASTPIYGVVNADKNKIDIPVGQTIATSATYKSIVLDGFDDPDVDNANLLPAGSKLSMSLIQQSPAKFDINLPFGSHILDIDSWYNIILSNVTFTKQ